MPKGKPRNSSSEVPIDENEHFIKLLEKALKSENIINSLKHAIVYDLQRDNAELKILLQEKYAKISELENRVDDLEQYTRIDDLIISGLTVRHRSYSSAVTHNNDIESQNAAFDDKTESVEEQLLGFLGRQGIAINKSDERSNEETTDHHPSGKPKIENQHFEE